MTAVKNNVIFILRLGGTLDQVYDKNGILVIPKALNFLYSFNNKEFVRILSDIGVNVKIKEFFLKAQSDKVMLFDSTNIHPVIWELLFTYINKEILPLNPLGIIITHGTDTLAYTSSMLSFMFSEINIPIVITGGQYPLMDKENRLNVKSDSFHNLINSIQFVTLNIPGVYVVFNGKIMNASRVTKVNSIDTDAFYSINYHVSSINKSVFIKPYEEILGEYESFNLKYIDPKIQEISKLYRMSLENKIGVNVRHYNLRGTKVFHLRVFPGIKSNIFKKIAEMGYNAIIIEGYGVGNIPSYDRDDRFDKNEIISIPQIFENESFDLKNSIKWFVENIGPVVINTQCIMGGVHPNKYEVGTVYKYDGVIPAFDMTKEASFTKLLWSMSIIRSFDNTKSHSLYERLSSIYRENISGEINKCMFSM